MEIFLQDLRYSYRSLKKSPLFTGTAIFCLTLSIGAVSAIFSVFNAIVLDPYPFEEPDALVDVQIVSRDFQFDDPNDPIFTLPQRAHDPFRADDDRRVRFGWKSDQGFAITEMETPISLQGAIVSTDYFDLVKPDVRLGRLFTAEDKDQKVAIISFREWTSTFGRDENIIGQPMTIDGVRHTIVGVLDRDHRYPSYANLWIPERTLGATRTRFDSRLSYNIMTRLEPGQSISQLNEELLAISDQFIEIDNGLFSRYRFLGFTVPELLGRGAQLADTVKMLLAAVIALLLIASANVANLMLSRMQQQEQELSLRAALGAPRTRLVRRLLMESGLIALVSAIAGVLLAYLMLPVFVEQADGMIQNPERVRIDAGVLVFSLLITIVSTLFVSLAPLIRVLRSDLASSLRAGGNKGMTGGSSQLRHTLVTIEAALTFMLLIGAGLMVKSFQQIQSIDMGFNTDNLQTFILYAPPSRRGSHDEAMLFYEEVRREILGVPGVVDMSYAQASPVTDRNTAYSMSIEDFPPEEPGDLIDPAPIGEIASHSYAESLEMKLIEGRFLTEQDRSDSLQVALISENMAKHYWPNESAVGKRLKRGPYTEATHPWLEIVGVVASMRSQPTQPAPHRFFRSVQQESLTRAYQDMRIMVRHEGSEGSIMPGIRDAIRLVAQDAVVANELTMNERVENGSRTQQLAMQIVLAFSVVGLVLAIAGIFGVFSYNVQQRYREIGLRMVLGARTQNVFILVLKSALGLGGLGLGIGLILTLSAKEYLETYLFQVEGFDPVVFGAVTAILLACIVAAACVPARRATMTDPADTLRHG